MYRTITHQYCARPVAFCCFKKHKGYLTARLMRDHHCLQRHCPCLKKLECEYWKHRDEMDHKRKERKKNYEKRLAGKD